MRSRAPLSLRSCGAVPALVSLLALVVGCAPEVEDLSSQVDVPVYLEGRSGSLVSVEGSWDQPCWNNGAQSWRFTFTISGSNLTRVTRTYTDQFCSAGLVQNLVAVSGWKWTGSCNTTKPWTNIQGNVPNPGTLGPPWMSMQGTDGTNLYVDSWYLDDTVTPHRLYVSTGLALDSCVTWNAMGAAYFQRQ